MLMTWVKIDENGPLSTPQTLFYIEVKFDNSYVPYRPSLQTTGLKIKDNSGLRLYTWYNLNGVNTEDSTVHVNFR